jgi:dipeptidyl aminopeptidase/acylaminoacyl peptidase
MGFGPQVWGSTSNLVYGRGALLEDLQTPPEVLHLYELRISTREIVRRLTKHPLPRSSQLSPDGRRAFYIVREGRDGTLYLLPSLDAEPEVLLQVDNGYEDFRWGSDSRHIVFVRQEPPEGYLSRKLYFIDVDGDRTPVRVPTPFADHDTPALYMPQE